MNADEAYALVERIKEFLDGFVDVNDGDYGVPTPNKAMMLVQGCDEMLEWLEKLP